MRALGFLLRHRRLLGYGALVLVTAGAVGFALHVSYERGVRAAEAACRAHVASAALAAHARANAERERRDRISYDAGRRAGLAQRRIETITKTHIEKVPVYVTQISDAACIVPLGFVRLHDAAASGTDLSALPDAAARPHDAASGFALSDVATAVGDNYGACHSVRQQLSDLQAWITAQIAVPRPR